MDSQVFSVKAAVYCRSASDLRTAKDEGVLLWPGLLSECSKGGADLQQMFSCHAAGVAKHWPDWPISYLLYRCQFSLLAPSLLCPVLVRVCQLMVAICFAVIEVLSQPLLLLLYPDDGLSLSIRCCSVLLE